ncbi:sporulation protein YunB [Desulfuribacillus alkaliarsenatis]|uniref:Sporulation protein YunB n=1 Tax=Desulfuribacillus alkaliarsenatis TaxID=766136 RepID=A0A1E5FYQ7_9FIRM|nr:sporulation protein YunB [Desulfuribacillus alkaliarsenatis]OEF95631.1 sporulation protein YunB [Desulfuribacillus alkaliarsenatis]
MPFFRLSKTKRRSIIVFVFLVITMYFAITAFYYVETNLRPNLISIAEIRAKKIATEAINDAISKKIAEETDYQRLLDIQIDNQGRVSFAQLNFTEVSRISSSTTIRVQNTLNMIEREVIRLPLGMAFNSAILSQYGPTIPITIVPQGAAFSDVKWSFEDAGINQTLHVIYIDIRAMVKIVIPFDTKETVIETRLPIAYSLYIGEVPQFFYDGRGIPIGEGSGEGSGVRPKAPNIFPPIQLQN